VDNWNKLLANDQLLNKRDIVPPGENKAKNATMQVINIAQPALAMLAPISLHPHSVMQS
jgi:hypothetical protein